MHKGVSYNQVSINLLTNEQNSPEFLKINPGGYVPALKIGHEVFGESLGMLEWIEEKFPQKPLLPSSADDRMRVRQMCLMIASGIQPLQNLSVLRLHSSDSVEQFKWASHWIDKGLTKLENLVSRHGGSFCFGGVLTLADICLVPQMYNAKRFNLDVTKYLSLLAVEQRCLQIVECQKTSPQALDPN
jgi:maleylacetoacetate isomerase